MNTSLISIVSSKVKDSLTSLGTLHFLVFCFISIFLFVSLCFNDNPLLAVIIKENNGLGNGKLYYIGANNSNDPLSVNLTNQNIFNYTSEANQLSSEGLYEEAITWYDKTLDISPKDFAALNGKGLALVELGHYDEGMAQYDKVLAIDPNNINSLYNKGKALDYLGRNEKGITYYDKALDLEPNDTKILNSKGLALHHSGSNEEAITYYDKVINLDPNDSDALYNKGVALDNLGRNEAAQIYYKKALAVNPDHVKALYNLGSGLYYSGDYDDAITYLDRVLTLEPDHIDSLNYKGKSLASLGKNDDAMVYFDKVLEIDPANVSARSQKELSLSVNYEADSSNSDSFVEASASDDFRQHSSNTATEVKTFRDSKTKVTFQYPSDWEIASDEYMESAYGDSEGFIVAMLPKSLDGSSISVIYEELPFSMSAKEYVNIIKRSLREQKDTSIGKPIPISIGSLDGYKYNVTASDKTLPDGEFISTQIVFVKNSKAFAITYFLGAEVVKDLEDIESMIESFEVNNSNKNEDNAENGDNNEIDDSDASINDKDLDNAKDKAKELLNEVFTSLFPQTKNKFTNTVYGVDISFPKNWTGIEMKVFFPMAVVSPKGFSFTDIFSTVSNATVDNIADSIFSDEVAGLSEDELRVLIEQKKQELTESASNKVIEYIENMTSTMGVFIYDKEFARLTTSLDPNNTSPVDSLTSLYERLFASDPTISCDRTTLDQITLQNNISAEMSTEQCSYTDSNKMQDNLNYFVLTPNAIVGIHYTSDPNKENDKFLSEFEESLKTLSVEETLPINNHTIQQFLNS